MVRELLSAECETTDPDGWEARPEPARAIALEDGQLPTGTGQDDPQETVAGLLRDDLAPARTSDPAERSAEPHDSPISAEDPSGTISEGAGEPAETDSLDDRIRALRVHLRQMQASQMQSRESHQLFTKLSRYWNA